MALAVGYLDTRGRPGVAEHVQRVDHFGIVAEILRQGCDSNTVKRRNMIATAYSSSQTNGRRPFVHFGVQLTYLETVERVAVSLRLYFAIP